MQTVVVTLIRKQVPESVTFGYMRFRVKVYVPRPIRCWRCHKFGHVEERCQAAVRCPTCGGDHRIMEAGGGQYDKVARCCNCGGGHSAAFKGCQGMLRGRRSYRLKWIGKFHMQKQSRFTESQRVKKGKSKRVWKGGGASQEKEQGEW